MVHIRGPGRVRGERGRQVQPLVGQERLVVDPATGRILDEVELLLEAGKLNIKVPAVIGYTSYD